MKNNYDVVIVPKGAVRDWQRTEVNAGNLNIRADQEEALALDLFIHNTGAANITVATNGQPAITVGPGGVYLKNDVKMLTIEVLAAVNYDMEVHGLTLDAMKRMGLM